MQLTGLELSSANDRARSTAICMVAVPKTVAAIKYNIYYDNIKNNFYGVRNQRTPITEFSIYNRKFSGNDKKYDIETTGRIALRRRKYGGGFGVLASVVV